eukprot:jgi/Botrbrau1/13191/Bobra.0351s0004.1
MASFRIPAKRRSVEYNFSNQIESANEDHLYSPFFNTNGHPWVKSGQLANRFWDVPPRSIAAETASPSVDWTPQDSSQIYNVSGWGGPYFSVGENGNVMVKPRGSGSAFDLYALAAKLKARGLQTPMLFRFPDVAVHRLHLLQGSFNAAIRRYKYQGVYQAVFPVKCNHDRQLISKLLETEHASGMGLEAGSKPEIMLAMSLLCKYPGSLLICNGYKDAEYMELVLRCRQLGINALLVLEQAQELPVMMEVARRTGVRPALGIRARLATRHKGHWGPTSGDKSKFGLRAREIVSVANDLATAGMLDCLQLLHFHMGSQINDIGIVKEGMSEASYLFAELLQMGAGMRYVDVGGGLAIDYDGSATSNPMSLSYNMQSYANDIVASLRDVCIERGIVVSPTIISESGRALASHHSVLVFDVLNRPSMVPDVDSDEGEEVAEDFDSRREVELQLERAADRGKGAFLLCTFKEVFDRIVPTAAGLQEAYDDALHFKEEALRAFKLGVLSLSERAQLEILFDATCARICHLAASVGTSLPEGLQQSGRPAASMYHANFSVFRSAVDTWAIKQLFPIMPIHRLEEEPSVRATLADLTCDSDGKIDCFIDPEGSPEGAPSLPLHELRPGEPYLLGLFLSGVYQEIMGSAHNMFGSVNTVHVLADEELCGGEDLSGPEQAVGLDCPLTEGDDGKLRFGSFVIDDIVRGQNIEEVLLQANHQGSFMLKAITNAAGARQAEGHLSTDSADALVGCFKRRLHSYTYLHQAVNN